MNPRIFIGSSFTSREIADELGAALARREVDVEVWTDGVFEPGETTHETLIRDSSKYDFGAFVTTADDRLIAPHDQEIWVPRDNVIFELGLFSGALGGKRCFIVYDDETKPKVPSDLKGVTYVPYKKKPDIASVHTIANQIKKLGPRPKDMELLPALKAELAGIRDHASAVQGSHKQSFQTEVQSCLLAWKQRSEEWTRYTVTVRKDYIRMLCDVYRQAERNVFSTCIPEYIPVFKRAHDIVHAHSDNPKHARVTRVFVFNTRGDEHPHLDVLRDQLANGITVLLYFDQDDDGFTFPPEHGNDWTVVDDGDVIGITQKFGKNIEARWSFGNRELKSTFNRYVTSLLNASIPFKE